MLVNQLEFLELGVYTIKKMLKESDYSLFNDIKTLVRGALKKTHLEFNPLSDNYKEDDLNEKAVKEAAKKVRLETLRKGSKIKKGIKKQELEATYRELFDIMDDDGDMILSQKEFRSFMQVNYELHGITHDTATESDHKIKQFYDMLDADHDGELSWTEVWNSLSAHYKGYYVEEWTDRWTS